MVMLHGAKRRPKSSTMKLKTICFWLLSIGIFPSLSAGATFDEDSSFWDRFLQSGELSMMSVPSAVPTKGPTRTPTEVPTKSPTGSPTEQPLLVNTPRPTVLPTSQPTRGPTSSPTSKPTSGPTRGPTSSPKQTSGPTRAPTSSPTSKTTSAPTSTPTSGPTSGPTETPTAGPTLGPTETPTVQKGEPTVAPTRLRTRDPTVAPTSNPTVSPTSLPTREPTSGPTASPSADPTARPTRMPAIDDSSPPSPAPTTDQPSSDPTLEPTQGPTTQPLPPTTSPSRSPTVAPSTAPTMECVIPVNNTCSVRTGAYAGQNCDELGLRFPTCMVRPTELTFLLTGGSCQDSSNAFVNGYSCIDTSSGPPQEQPSPAYIIVTDAKGEAVYHRDWVFYGSSYQVMSPLGTSLFPDYQRILIYSSNETGNPANLLQEVQYPSSCTQPLTLKNQLGASQLTGFINGEQGNVTCFAPLSITIDIGVASDFLGGFVDLREFDVLSNFGGLQDFSDLVQDVRILPGEWVSYDIPTYVADLSQRRRYTSLAQVTGNAESGLQCQGTAFDSFLAGNPIDPPLPSTPPSVAPSGSPAPTIDNLLTACTVGARISCECLTEDGLAIGPCENILDPRVLTCSDDLPATGLTFKYVGFDGTSQSPNAVFVQVSSPSGLQFSTAVDIGSIFKVDGNFAGRADISVYEGTTPDNLIDQFSLATDCSPTMPVLSLSTIFGSLELVGYENGLGYFSSIIQIRLTYTIINRGNFAMVAESAVIDSEFRPEPFNALDGDVSLEAQEVYTVLTEPSTIDVGAKFRQGAQFQFALDVAGRGERSSVACFAGFRYSF